MLPMLRLLADGRIRHMSDLRGELAQEFDISDADRQILQPSGRTRLFDNRVAWARTDLGMAGAVDSASRGSIRITERGRAILAEDPKRVDRKLLGRYPEFEAFMSRKRVKSSAQMAPPAEEIDVHAVSVFPGQDAPDRASVPMVNQADDEQLNAVPRMLSFTDAAESVLQQYGDRKPMHYRAITQRVLALGLVRTQGQTPEATLYSGLREP